MIKEELEKEAEKYFKSICGDYNEEYERTGKRHYWVGFDIKNAYLASAEPREKRIEELIALINAERERQEKCDDVHLRKIAELEKENTGLKKQLEMSNKVYNDNLDYSHHIEGQLTKAKELLKWWVNHCSHYDLHYAKKTEQFLKE